MSESLYTRQRTAKFRGPTTSDDYNTRIEDLYKDLVYLYNKIGLANEDIVRFYKRIIKDHFALGKLVEDLKERIAALEADQKKLTFNTASQMDNDRFVGTPYAIPAVSQCHTDKNHGLLVLPKVESSSISKLKFVNSDGSTTVPSTFEMLVKGIQSSADNTTAFIDTSDPYYAVVNQTGKIWERNVVVNSVYGNGAQAEVFVRVPTDTAVVADSNCVVIHPFPAMGTELVKVEYSTNSSIALNDNDDYHPLNSATLYSGESSAVGWIAPGGWSGDSIEDCGPKAFYFDPKTVTALKFTLKQRSYLADANKIIYTYGMSALDLRYDKFIDTGRAMLRFDAPAGHVINSITSVTPQIWNVSEAEMDDVFSYRAIWETSYNSGVYTTVAPGAAKRVWIEVSMAKTLNKGTPALSGLIVSYS